MLQILSCLLFSHRDAKTIASVSGCKYILRQMYPGFTQEIKALEQQMAAVRKSVADRQKRLTLVRNIRKRG